MSEPNDRLAAIERQIRALHHYGDPPDVRLAASVERDVAAIMDDVRDLLAASPGPTESDRRDTERLDAARYRYLRARMEIRSEATLLGHFARCVSVQIGRSRIGALRDAYQQCERDDAFDAAIDAAMSSVGSSNATEEGA